MKKGLLPLQTLPRPLLRRLDASAALRRLSRVNAAARAQPSRRRQPRLQLSPPNTSNNNTVPRQTLSCHCRAVFTSLIEHPPFVDIVAGLYLHLGGNEGPKCRFRAPFR